VLDLLIKYGFPSPTHLQYKVSLGTAYAHADLAYVNESKDKTVLIFIDGMSKKIHGNEEQRRKDKLIRTKIKMEGYKVIETTAQALNDKIALVDFLNELALYLELNDLIRDI
jgi:hypothetical protein